LTDQGARSPVVLAEGRGATLLDYRAQLLYPGFRQSLRLAAVVSRAVNALP